MSVDVIQDEGLRSQRAEDVQRTTESPTLSRRARFRAGRGRWLMRWLMHWLMHGSVLLAMTDPEAVVALGYGVPNLDDDTLVQLMQEHRAGM